MLVCRVTAGFGRFPGPAQGGCPDRPAKVPWHLSEQRRHSLWRQARESPSPYWLRIRPPKQRPRNRRALGLARYRVRRHSFESRSFDPRLTFLTETLALVTAAAEGFVTVPDSVALWACAPKGVKMETRIAEYRGLDAHRVGWVQVSGKK